MSKENKSISSINQNSNKKESPTNYNKKESPNLKKEEGSNCLIF